MAKKQVKIPRKSASKAKKHSTKLSQKRTKATKRQKTQKASPKSRSPYPRAASNPFRHGSSYAICFDVLAAHPEGLSRKNLIEQLAKATKKPIKNAGYDAAVVLSAKENGERHQSCKPGAWWIEKVNDHVCLRTK